MNILVTARHFKAKQELQDYAHAEAAKLERHFDRITTVELVLSFQKKDQIAELIVKVPKDLLRVETTTDDMMKSIDQAVGKMVRQLKKYKDQLQGK
jgi:putative sigma-54 modulation protein